MDLYAGSELKRDTSPFLEMLWRRGRAHEDKAIQTGEVQGVDLRSLPEDQRKAATIQALGRRTPLIYGGSVSCDDLAGEPDVLRHIGGGNYIPGDIKIGAGEEGHEESKKKPKKHYGVQLALYVDILERLGFSDGLRQAFVIDIHGDEVPYDLVAAKGKRTPGSLWEDYLQCVTVARELIAGTRYPGPSYQGECKNCVWYHACLMKLEEQDDLTLLPGLGKAKREALLAHVTTVREFAESSPMVFVNEKGKSIVPGFSADSIAVFRERAILKTTNGSAYTRSPISVPQRSIELFFDIETDPMGDHCYLHGFIERKDSNNLTETYMGFFSDDPTPASEREAFAAAWTFVQSKMPCVIYVYSKYEQTWWTTLQAKYPDVCEASAVASMFADETTVDLYAVVQANTEWPTRDYSIKSLAQHLGFAWRDAHPSGAASIEWFDRFRQGDKSAKMRLLEYNEDDCRAMRVLLDGIKKLPLKSAH